MAAMSATVSEFGLQGFVSKCNKTRNFPVLFSVVRLFLTYLNSTRIVLLADKEVRNI